MGKNRFDTRVGRRYVSRDENGARRLRAICNLWNWFAGLDHRKLSEIDEYVLHAWDPKLKDVFRHPRFRTHATHPS